MKSILSQLSQTVGAAFAACGYDEALGAVHASDRPDLCQYQCNGAFAGAKLYRKAPLAIAQQVTEQLAAQADFVRAECVKPGFINLTLTDEAMARCVNELAADAHLGVPQAETPETVILDYGGPNVAKPLHIGHLRPAIIGEALKRLLRACGHTVISDVHFGDWGLPIGLVTAELEARQPGFSCYGDGYRAGDPLPHFTAEELNEIYPAASAKSKEDAAFSARAHALTVALQRHDAGMMALWQEIMRISVDTTRENYRRLNVSFDLWYGESNADAYMQDALEALKTNAGMHKDQGAMIVDVAQESDKSPVPPMLAVKSDGGVTYAATDVATLLLRMREFSPQRVFYVTDTRQGLHFTQVFRAARKAGIVPPEVELAHLPNGTMNGSDGKPYKTRSGGVLPLAELLDTVEKAAAEKMADSAYVDGDRQELARKVGIAAVKFGDLINHRSKDYVFDLDKFLAFEGKTGTYVLYTVTRINSILKRAGVDAESPVSLGALHSDEERELARLILGTPGAFEMALGERAPNYLCENAYQLAVAFSAFYHSHRILDEPDAAVRADWLALCVLVRRLILMQLDVLGIEAVENM